LPPLSLVRPPELLVGSGYNFGESSLLELAVRRTLSFLFASAILLAGLALSILEIIQAQNLRPFVQFGALVMVVAGGAWLLDDLR
jgi:hypothetical protein